LENSSTPAAAGSKIDQAWVDKCCQVARHRAVSQQCGMAASSRLHSNVSAEVRRLLGRSELVQDELVIEDCLVVDIALPRLHVLIEVDGSSHFITRLRGAAVEATASKDQHLELCGASKFKRRLLQRLGWQVRSVEWHTWQRLGSNALRSQHLRELLASVGA
ncbi:unnamed protein product, partial [Polarella glacialis]